MNCHISEQFHEQHKDMCGDVVVVTLKNGENIKGYFNDEFYEETAVLISPPFNDVIIIKISDIEKMVLAEKYRCLGCNYKTLPYEAEKCVAYVCPVCYWENDVFMVDMNDINERSDENHGMTLKEARENFLKYGAVRKNFAEYTRKPTIRETE